MRAAERGGMLGLGLLSVLVVLYGWLRASAPDLANHDLAWNLEAGRKLLAGGVLGVDVIDNNPPLVFWVAAAVVWLAQQIAVPPLELFALLSGALAALAALSVQRAFRTSAPELSFALAGVALLAVGVLPAFHVGQRELWIVCGLLPLLLARANAPEGPPRWGLALAAAAVVALKPPYLLVPLAAELALGTGRRGLRALWRAELIVLTLALLIYALSVWLFAREWLAAAPELWRLYRAYEGWFETPWQPCAVAAIALFSQLAAPLRSAAASALAMAGVASLIVALAQNKGYPYHYLPAECFAALALAAALGRGAARLSSHARALGAGGLLTACIVLASRALMAPPPSDLGPVELALTEIIEREAAGAQVVGLGTTLDPVFPALAFTSAHWGLSLGWPFVIAGNYPRTRERKPFPYRSRAEMPRLEREAFEDVLRALKAPETRLVVVDHNRFNMGFGGYQFDALAYYAVDPAVREALGRYVRIGTLAPDFELFARPR
jgi:hypothetical protein